MSKPKSKSTPGMKGNKKSLKAWRVIVTEESADIREGDDLVAVVNAGTEADYLSRADLIAAAPDALKLIRALRGKIGLRLKLSELQEIDEQIEAFIAKAEGRDHE